MEECFVCTEIKEENMKYCLFCNFYVCLNCVNELMINFKNKCTICKKNIPYGYNNIITTDKLLPNLKTPLIGIYIHNKKLVNKYISIKYQDYIIKDVFLVTYYEGGTLLTNFNKLPLEKLDNFSLLCDFEKISYILNTFECENHELLVIHNNSVFIITDTIKEKRQFYRIKYKDIQKMYSEKKEIYNNLVILNNYSLNYINDKNGCWKFFKRLFTTS